MDNLSDDMMDGLDDFSETKPAPAASTPAPSGQRIRAGKEMISLRYRSKQFLLHGGGELLLILSLLVLFWLLLVPPFRGSGAIYSGKAAIPALLSQLSTTPLAVALFAVLPTAGAVMFLFFALREIATPEAGIAGALLLTVLPAFLSSSFFVNQAALTQLFAAAALFMLFRNNTQKKPLTSVIAGFLWFTAICTGPAFLPVLLALPLAVLVKNPNRAGIPLFFGGAAIALVLVEVVLQSVLGNPLLSGIRELAHLSGPANPGALFLQLFTAPELAPFALIAIFALGYTARAGSAVFPIQPALFFLLSYLLLDLLPLSLNPYGTFPTNFASLSLPLASLGGMFLGSLLDRSAIRWLGTAILLPALASLLIRL